MRRLPCLVWCCEVRVALCSSRYSSPTQTGGSTSSPLARSKKASGCSQATRALPSRSARRAALPVISRVVPPPPSPQPTGAIDPLASRFSRNWTEALATSAPDSCEL